MTFGRKQTDRFHASVLTDIVITSVAHGSYPLRLVREIGQPMPAFTTAVGRVLMTYLSNDEIVQRSRAHVGVMAWRDRVAH